MTGREIPAEFWARLAAAKKRVLMLDYDGTLAPFKVIRDEAGPYSGVREAIGKIMEGGTRVVVITGRRAIEIVALLKLAKIPEIWGLHGFERQMPDGSVTVGSSTGREDMTIVQAAKIARLVAGETAVEQKLSGVAVHFRGLNESEANQFRRSILSKWHALSLFPAFTVRNFDGGIEMRLFKITKANAVISICSESGEDAVIAYLGDDDTDEDAFKAMKGRGLSVLVRGDFRETNADVWIKPPEELIDFLDRWNAAQSGGGEREVIKDD